MKDAGNEGFKSSIAAVCDVLRSLFADVTSRSTDELLIVTCRGLRRHPNRAFHVPPETTIDIAMRICEVQAAMTIPRQQYREWMQAISRKGVILVAPFQRLGVMVFHQWRLSFKGLAELERSAGGALAIKLHAVSDTAVLKRTLQEAILQEINRTCGHPDAMFHASTDIHLNPFSEETFLEDLDVTGLVETPASLLAAAAADGTISMAFNSALNAPAGWNGPPVVAEAIASARARSAARRRNWRALGTFASCCSLFARHRKVPRLPSFSLDNVSAWRAFAAKYPRCLSLLHAVICKSQHANDVMFAAVIVSSLAHSSETRVLNEVGTVARSIAAREHDFPGYAFRRQMLLSQVEARAGNRMAGLIDHITAATNQGFESQYLWSYGGGWGGNYLSRIDRKIRNPTARDIEMVPFHSAMGENYVRSPQVFLNGGIGPLPAELHSSHVFLPVEMPLRAEPERKAVGVADAFSAMVNEIEKGEPAVAEQIEKKHLSGFRTTQWRAVRGVAKFIHRDHGIDLDMKGVGKETTLSKEKLIAAMKSEAIRAAVIRRLVGRKIHGPRRRPAQVRKSFFSTCDFCGVVREQSNDSAPTARCGNCKQPPHRVQRATARKPSLLRCRRADHLLKYSTTYLLQGTESDKRPHGGCGVCHAPLVPD